MTESSVLDGYHSHVSAGLARVYRLLGAGIESHAAGLHVWSSSGKDYLDFGGFGVFLFGHRHPHIMAGVRACLSEIGLSSRAMASPWTSRAASMLAQSTGGRLPKVMFANSGAEAVEFAMKAAVKATGRSAFAALNGAFHGKTLAALSLTYNSHYKSGLETALQPVRHFPAGDDGALFAFLESGTVAALVVEPIQSENGVIPVDPEWLVRVARVARQHGTILIVDEVSTGCGRTGRFWRSEAAGLLDHVDILIAGKALGGGIMPIGAALARTEIFRPFDADPLLHTSTFAGNPVACAAAIATIELLNPGCLAEIQRKGRLLREGLTAMVNSWPLLAVRGEGLLIGVEFSSEGSCGVVTHELIQRRILVQPGLGSIRTLRLTPPAVITDGDIAHFLEMFSLALSAAVRQRDIIMAMEELGAARYRDSRN